MSNRPVVMLVGAVVLVVAVVPAVGQQAVQNQDVLRALLVEVRGLRLAMEQMGSAAARVQLAMGRLQLQEQRINTMVRRLEAVRDQKISVEREITDMRNDATRMEDASTRAENPEERKMAALHGAELKRRAEQRTAEVQRLTAEEVETANAIAAEQSRWTDINRTLEELERALAGK